MIATIKMTDDLALSSLSAKIEIIYPKNMRAKVAMDFTLNE